MIISDSCGVELMDHTVSHCVAENKYDSTIVGTSFSSYFFLLIFFSFSFSGPHWILVCAVPSKASQDVSVLHYLCITDMGN